MVSYVSSGEEGGSGGKSTNKGERETHVKHTQVSTEIFWAEKELLHRKARLIASGRYHEPKTEWIGMRVGHTIREIYRKAPDNIKRAARQAFEAVLLSWLLGTETVELNGQAHAQPLTFNINIINNEARAEARAEVNLPERLIKALEELERFLDFIAYQSSKQLYPLPVKQKAARGLDALKELRRYLGITN